MITRKKSARENVGYRTVIACAIELLREKGIFSFDEVLEKTEYVGSDFNWDLIRVLVEEDSKKRLFPVSVDAFKRRKKDDNIGKLLAIGYGKKAAGYVVACDDTVTIVNASLTLRRNQIIGAGKQFSEKRIAAMADAPAIETCVKPLRLVENGAATPLALANIPALSEPAA